MALKKGITVYQLIEKKTLITMNLGTKAYFLLSHE